MSDAYPDGGLGHVCADKRTMGYFGPAVNMYIGNNCHNVTAPRNRSDRSGPVREVLVPSIAKKIYVSGYGWACWIYLMSRVDRTPNV